MLNQARAQNTPQTILIVEDNDDDFEATERAFLQNKALPNPVHRCRDGLEAWAYLKGEGKFAAPAKPSCPGLVLLDLNMPGLDGRMLLKRMKSDPLLKSVVVVVMTTSTEEEDIKGCYEAGVNTYTRKPVSWIEFAEAIARLQEYWFRIAILPTEPRR